MHNTLKKMASSLTLAFALAAGVQSAGAQVVATATTLADFQSSAEKKIRESGAAMGEELTSLTYRTHYTDFDASPGRYGFTFEYEVGARERGTDKSAYYTVRLPYCSQDKAMRETIACEWRTPPGHVLRRQNNQPADLESKCFTRESAIRSRATCRK